MVILTSAIGNANCINPECSEVSYGKVGSISNLGTDGVSLLQPSGRMVPSHRCVSVRDFPPHDQVSYASRPTRAEQSGHEHFVPDFQISEERIAA